MRQRGHTSRQPAEKGGLHEKSYPCNDQEHSFPVARNAYESNANDVRDLSCAEKKREKIRPVSTISREVMRMGLGGRYSQKHV
jgi:hypothetical protein